MKLQIRKKNLEFDPFTTIAKHKIQIEDRVIKNVPIVNLLDFGGPEDKNIQTLHKRLLKKSKDYNDCNEVAFIINYNTWEYVEVMGTEGNVSYGNIKASVGFLKKPKKNSIIIMHNHPNCATFSFDDLISFTLNDGILLLTAISNNGNIHIIRKRPDFDKYSILSILKIDDKSNSDLFMY